MLGLFDGNEKLLITAAVGVFAIVASKFFFAGKARKTVLDPNEYRKFKLVEKELLTQGACPVYRFRFALPKPDDVLGLPVGQHLSFKAMVDGKEITRSYTPTSSNDDLGFFELVVKVYPRGNMSRFIDSLAIGDSIDVRGPKGKFVYKKNQYKKLGMIAGGTGITPMLQVIREVLKHKDDKTELSLIFANVTEQDIILKDQLDQLAKNSPNFKVYYVLNEPPPNWKGGVGFVTKEMIQEHLPAPSDDVRVLLCGPPPMLKAMYSNLEALSYPKESIFTF
eukprot:GEZU01032724.1.p2 GENE.GEZU01032724.1~~GEZU01032724.1.p2  ORF type:complete len:288 (+),score=139.79 GEZU01032724.1:28-864(+)